MVPQEERREAFGPKPLGPAAKEWEKSKKEFEAVERKKRRKEKRI